MSTSTELERRSTRRMWGWRAGFVLACLIHLYGLYSPHQAGSGAVEFPSSDKIAHLALFGSVAYLGLRVGVPGRWLLPVLAANAVISELVQHYLLPLRSGDPLDSVADLCGVAVGAFLGYRALRATKVAGHDMMGE